MLNRRRHTLIKQITACGAYAGIACTLGLIASASMAHHDDQHGNPQRHLILEMTPAMCALYPVRANNSQCLNRYHITSQGLDLGYRCTSSLTPDISPVQRRVLRRIIPDQTYINQAWRRYGSCSPYDAKGYFRQLISLSDSINMPLRLQAHDSFMISKDLFLADMHRANPGIAPHNIRLSCESSTMSQPILTKITICFEDANYASCPLVDNSCGDNFIVWGTAR